MPPETEVPLDVAYAAAVQRAERLTHALILSEAHVLTLQRTVNELGEENTRLAVAMDHARVRGEVMHDAAQDGDEGSAAGGEAGVAHPFHD
jgi:hypothetical protein